VKMARRAEARRAKAGAPGRTRTECLRTATIRVYETRPVAAEARGLQNLRFAIDDLRFENKLALS